MISKLQGNKNQILFIELAGLLHDVGKLSKAFLEYRQKWQDDTNGYDNDPHDHSYLDDHEVFKSIIPPDFDKAISEIGGDNFGEPDFSIKNAVHYHVSSNGRNINKMLKAADGVDSAIDRNNPLWSAEQKGMIFRSNVFGYERGRVVTFESQEGARQKLYSFLNSNLPAYLTSFDCNGRLAILKDIKAAFEKGLADTTRPSNDTTLWEHSYAVASILKVIAVHNLFATSEDNKIYDFKKVKFGILGIGWDGISFISSGQRIGDIVGRKEALDNVTSEIRRLIEHEYPIGNEIYSDDDGIYFIVPIELKGKLKEIWTEVEKEIYRIAAGKSEGEIQPHIVYFDQVEKEKNPGAPSSESEPSYINTLTQLCRAIKKMTEKISYRYDSSVEGFKDIETRLKYKDGKTVCPICRLRPVKDDTAKKKVCETCIERRNNRDRPQKNKETVFIDEIVDDNRRATLLVARFGLDEWLSGRMVRSLFVKEARGLERAVANIENVKQFEKEGNDIKKFHDNNYERYGEFKYNRIKDDIDAFFENKVAVQRQRHTAFLYAQRVKGGSLFRETKEVKEDWDKLLKQAKEEDKNIDIYNLLTAKTPTPSTILDVWDTTLEFFQDISNNLLKELLPENKRLRLKLEPTNGIELYDWGKGTLEAEVVETRQRIEILYDNGEVEVIGVKYSEDRSSNEWNGRHIRIIDEESRLLDKRYQIRGCKAGTAFIPCRTMTVSPNLFMTIVPADRAIEISDIIYREYIEQFGKIMGRLPFSIGNVFFGEKMPMFVVLDAGKRMIANFDSLGEKDKKKEYTVVNKEDVVSAMRFGLKCRIEGHDRTLTWQLPHKLGNCEDDYHHPYFIVKKDGKDYTSRKNYFKTVAGEVIHFMEVQAEDLARSITGDVLELYPNYYDFEFLDSNARRYDINLDDKGRRKSNVADFRSKPFLLDELSQKIMHTWNALLKGRQLKGITDTKLRNLQSLWLTKYQEWVRDGISGGVEEWKKFVRASIDKEFKESDQKEFLHETIESGLFFDTLELYLGILKDRIEK